jgi:hypothetical protein
VRSQIGLSNNSKSVHSSHRPRQGKKLTKRHHSTNQTHAQSCKEPAGTEHRLPRARGLQNDAQVEHDARRSHETVPTAQQICDGSSEQSAEESSSGQDGDDKGVLRGGDGGAAAGRERVLPVVYGEDTGDGAGAGSILG